MIKGPFVCCLVVLASASLASGQINLGNSPPVAVRAVRGGGVTPVEVGNLGKAAPPIVLAGPLAEPGSVPIKPEYGSAPSPLAAEIEGPSTPYYVTLDADFLLWVTQGERASRTLFLRGPGALTALPGLGNLNRVGPPLTGGRFTVGVWVPEHDPILQTPALLPIWGGELSYLFLGERTVSVLGEATVPGLGTTNLSGSASYRIWGIEAIARCNAHHDSPGQMLRVDLLGGLRNLNLAAKLTANQRTSFEADLTGFPAFQSRAGAQINHTASYQADNSFFGGEVGVGFQLFTDYKGYFGADFKLALGTNYQELKINGQVQSTPSLPAQTASRFPADSGSFSRCTFSYIPELNVYMALPLGDCITVRAGYTLFYWSKLVRAADQIELATSGGASGTFEVFRERGLVVQGLNLALELSF